MRALHRGRAHHLHLGMECLGLLGLLYHSQRRCSLATLPTSCAGNKASCWPALLEGVAAAAPRVPPLSSCGGLNWIWAALIAPICKKEVQVVLGSRGACALRHAQRVGAAPPPEITGRLLAISAPRRRRARHSIVCVLNYTTSAASTLRLAAQRAATSPPPSGCGGPSSQWAFLPP